MLDNVRFVKGNRAAFANFIAACVGVLYDNHIELYDEEDEWRTNVDIFLSLK